MIVVSGTAIGAVATVIVALIQTTPKKEDPEHDPMRQEIEALQGRLDTVQSDQTRLKKCVRLLGEAVCALNDGPMGSGWDECPPHVYRHNRAPPPLHRTDRVYADCMELLR